MHQIFLNRKKITYVLFLFSVPDFPVTILQADSLTSSSISVAWQPALPLTGKTSFEISITHNEMLIDKSYNQVNTSLKVFSLKVSFTFVVNVSM